MNVKGELDHVAGGSLELARRAERQMRAAGTEDVHAQIKVVLGEPRKLDLPPTGGTSDLRPKRQAILKGINWLTSHTQVRSKF